MITAIAIDDEPLALDVIKNFCNKVDTIDLRECFTSTADALAYLKEHPVELLFLDINMPALSGIDFYKIVAKETRVIFTTAYSEYAVEGFNLSALDYLLKPFEFSRFKQAVDKASDYYAVVRKKEAASPQYLLVKADYSVIKIDVADIVYIEGLDNYLKIHLVNKKSIVARMSMKAMSEKLPAGMFLRVHRSFIVPFSKITSVRNKTIYLDGIEVPIGTNYMESVLGLFRDRKLE